MKIFKLLTSTLLLLIILASCQKEFTPEEVPISPIDSTNDSVLLSKYYVLDTTQATPFDTLSVVTYKYDASKRMIQMLDGQEYGPDAKPSFLDDYSFSYNGNDTVPSKITILSTTSSFPGFGRDTILYYRDGAGKIIKDSTSGIFDDASGKITTSIESNVYNYLSGNRIIRTQISGSDVFGPFSYQESVTNFYLTLTAGNITSQQDTTFIDNTATTIEDFNYKFDDKPNPFYRSLRAFTFYPIYYESEFEIQIVPVKNNFLEINHNESMPGLGGFYRSFVYQYRLDNYPVSVIISKLSDITNPLSKVYEATGHFIYTK